MSVCVRRSRGARTRPKLLSHCLQYKADSCRLASRVPPESGHVENEVRCDVCALTSDVKTPTLLYIHPPQQYFLLRAFSCVAIE